MTRLVRLGGARHLLIRLPVPAVPLSSLTPSERAVVLLVLEGASNRDIATARQTSQRTVANQLSSAYGKLGVRSRSELARTLSGSEGQPNAAVKELLTGAWTLVEQVASSERRWVIARPSSNPLRAEERQALELRALGKTLRDIASTLDTSEPTASRLVQRGMRKLGIRSVAELARVLADCA
ncbi:MAG: hypothetical protein IPI67_20760 [Myxococcales bacterium]|nr:hypothetical protein [Myxococcales bacterium]